MQRVLILIERVCQRRTFCKVVFNYVATTSQLANTNIFKQLNIQVGCSTATQWAIGPCNCQQNHFFWYSLKRSVNDTVQPQAIASTPPPQPVSAGTLPMAPARRGRGRPRKIDKQKEKSYDGPNAERCDIPKNLFSLILESRKLQLKNVVRLQRSCNVIKTTLHFNNRGYSLRVAFVSCFGRPPCWVAFYVGIDGNLN